MEFSHGGISINQTIGHLHDGVAREDQSGVAHSCNHAAIDRCDGVRRKLNASGTVGEGQPGYIEGYIVGVELTCRTLVIDGQLVGCQSMDGHVCIDVDGVVGGIQIDGAGQAWSELNRRAGVGVGQSNRIVQRACGGSGRSARGCRVQSIGECVDLVCLPRRASVGRKSQQTRGDQRHGKYSRTKRGEELAAD